MLRFLNIIIMIVKIIKNGFKLFLLFFIFVYFFIASDLPIRNVTSALGSMNIIYVNKFYSPPVVAFNIIGRQFFFGSITISKL